MICRKDPLLQWPAEPSTESRGLAHLMVWHAEVHSSYMGDPIVGNGKHPKKVNAKGLAFADLFRKYVSLRTGIHQGQEPDE
jgi:hypothetical protein